MDKVGQVVSRHRSQLAWGLFASLAVGALLVASRLGRRPDIHPAESQANAGPGFVVDRPLMLSKERRSVAGQALQPPPRGIVAEPHQAPSMEMTADRRRHKELHDRAIANHNIEPVREPWASQLTASLRADFEKLAPDGAFTLVGIDCRSTTCLTTVEWPNYGVASQKWPSILHHAYASRCGTRVFLDEPAPDAPAYRTTVVTSCTDATPAPPRSETPPP